MAHHFTGLGQMPVWGSVVALAQSAGRGQLGRTWHSEPGNLFVALRLPLEGPFTGPEAAPAFGGLLAESLHMCGYDAGLKWPNDLVVMYPDGPRKAGGILLEERRKCLLAGIGLNLVTAPPGAALREAHALPGGCLRPATGAPENFLSLWLRLVGALKICYEQSPPGSPASFAARWRALAESRLLYLGEDVDLVDGAHDAIHLHGSVSGLDPDGGLRLRAPDGMHTVHSGSLTPRQTTTSPKQKF